MDTNAAMRAGVEASNRSPKQPRAARHAAVPSSTVALPTPPEGAEVLLMPEAAALLGIKLCALRIWINGRGKPQGMSPELFAQLRRPARYRAPGPYVRNPRICYLRSEIEALGALIESSYEPYAHPDTINYPGCHLIPMTGATRRTCAIIDSADLPLVAGHRWNVAPRARVAGNRTGLVVLRVGSQAVLLKQVILGVRSVDEGADNAAGAPAHDINIVHLNDNPLDCRRANLRLHTRSKQSWGNGKVRTRCGFPTTSGFKGVSWSEQQGCWCVYISKQGRSYYLGSFLDEVAAAREYDNAARWLFGEYAKLNFPLERPALRVPSAGALSRPGAIERVAA